jgi:cyclophilin family peptidyl-prolyl cis-trans isomerase
LLTRVVGSRGRACVLLLCCAAFACGEAGFARPAEEAELLHRVLIAEDARGRGSEAEQPLRDGIVHESPEIRRIAVRALGRLERSELVDAITPLLADSDPTVRAEAANAVAQAVSRGDGASARSVLLEWLAAESDPDVIGALAESVGRSRHAAAEDVTATATAIVERSIGQPTSQPGDPSGSARDLRVAKGLYLLARQPVARQALPDAAVAWLRAMLATTSASLDDPLAAQRTRTLAIAGLIASGHATGEDFRQAMADAEPLVRRETFAVPRALAQDSATARELVARGLEDPSHIVRYQALSAWAGVRRAGDCDPPQRLARDPSAHVALRAIDLLATCPNAPAVVGLLDGLALALSPADTGAWHAPAHALLALAALDPARARGRLDPFVQHLNGFVRAYAARAAGTLGERGWLAGLARDADPNVRVASIEALSTLDGRAADPVVIEQLDQNDPQLLMTAANLLEGTRDPSARQKLFGALERTGAARRETSRDARVALLERIGELGNAADLPRVQPLLQDFDPAVATAAAEAIGAWSGTAPATSPVALAAAPMPTPAALDSLEGAVFTVTMARGGSFDVRLRAWDAPTNAYRFVRLSESGYFDGLTYHRVAPNFVIQGGSPAANEYSGDGPFTRDELGLDGHWRGTLGISTRGRDTGDAQMFVNLIDNVRLDHEYTVFGEVVRGMDVVDGIQEGDVIQSIRRAAP